MQTIFVYACKHKIISLAVNTYPKIGCGRWDHIYVVYI